ncbi:hypothetical protein [Collimonas humicola]|uniref:hypothetical protein n=1 Tax=Collimonas humicola TaxID=2825886 RepID=UPI001E58F3FD|nr:hypothetical protein [Collimonas humicola]
MDTPVICEKEYLRIVAEFDFLWGRRTTMRERARMDYLITLINVFDAALAAEPAEN